MAKWIEIKHTEYMQLFSEIEQTRGQLSVFASATDISGYYHSGKPYAMTEWGLADDAAPCLKYIMSGQIERYYKTVDGVQPTGNSKHNDRVMRNALLLGDLYNHNKDALGPAGASNTYECSNCNTAYHVRGDSTNAEVYDFLQMKWVDNCPQCGSPLQLLDKDSVREEFLCSDETKSK